MRITRVVFQDYRVYAGKQELDMSRYEVARPVVLVGGLNGEGKTTLLEGIQLGLYGRRSELWRQTSSSYSDYLLQSIHRAANPTSGAMVQVEFDVTRANETSTYKVQRTWKRNGGGKAEEFVQVFIDGELDGHYSETWADQVEQFVPARLAGLFFFDGEKIKHYAETQRSRELIERGIQSLLGIDVVDQLDIDLKALEARITKEDKNQATDQKRQQLEEQRDTRTYEVETLNEKLAGLRNENDQLQKRFDQCDRSFAEAGGELYEKRLELESQRKILVDQLSGAKSRLVGLSGTALPLALVPELLKRTQLQMRVEIQIAGSQATLDRLADQETRLLDRLVDTGVGSRTTAEIESFFGEEREDLQKITDLPAYLDASQEDYLAATALSETGLPSLQAEVAEALKSAAKLETRIDALDRQLASVPDEDAVAKLQEEREHLRHEMAVLSGKIQQLEEDRRLAGIHLRESEEALHKYLIGEYEKSHDAEDRARVLKHAERVRDTLLTFRQRLIARRIEQLERLILESYGNLMRKSGMVARLRIDPETYDLSLFSADNKQIAPDWLSAGERQLLVVSILWGLARASGRSLPVIVDTPLGRLDSLHRDNLVKHYFPHASHQVILLSTDEEIVGHTLRALEPAIGRKYRLEYDDKRDATQIVPGYFKEQVGAN